MICFFSFWTRVFRIHNGRRAQLQVMRPRRIFTEGYEEREWCVQEIHCIGFKSTQMWMPKWAPWSETLLLQTVTHPARDLTVEVERLLLRGLTEKWVWNVHVCVSQRLWPAIEDQSILNHIWNHLKHTQPCENGWNRQDSATPTHTLVTTDLTLFPHPGSITPIRVTCVVIAGTDTPWMEDPLKWGGGAGKDPRNRSRDGGGGRHGNFVGRMVLFVPAKKQEDRVLMGDGHG